MPDGKVYLVGAGPGDLKLITLKGWELIKKADVIIYDHLVNKKLLSFAKNRAELIYAGKSSHNQSMNQKEINQLIVKKARSNRVVVRLKGGDPFVFARGAEEALVLAESNIPFEIVPGISSAVAGPAYAGIPLTHRDYTSSFTVLTGQEAEQGRSKIDWNKISSAEDTLVILMGVANLEKIISQLLEHGKRQDTPVAAIHWATTREQVVIVGTLQTIVDKTRKKGLKPPAVIVVGKIVNLRQRLNWFERRPLFGKRVLVTRAKHQAAILTELLEEKGACVIEFPVIEIAPPVTFQELDKSINKLERYDWVIFTSVNGVRHFLNRLRDLGKFSDLKGRRLCAIGPQTARALEENGLAVSCMPKEYRQEGIIEELQKKRLKEKSVLLPTAEKAREILKHALSRMGAKIRQVTVYRAVRAPRNPNQIRSMLAEGKIDIVTFTSPSCVKNFVELFKRKDEILNLPLVACIGPVTRDAAQGFGIKADIVANEFTITGLVGAIERHFQND